MVVVGRSLQSTLAAFNNMLLPFLGPLLACLAVTTAAATSRTRRSRVSHSHRPSASGGAASDGSGAPSTSASAAVTPRRGGSPPAASTMSPSLAHPALGPAAAPPAGDPFVPAEVESMYFIVSPEVWAMGRVIGSNSICVAVCPRICIYSVILNIWLPDDRLSRHQTLALVSLTWIRACL